MGNLSCRKLSQAILSPVLLPQHNRDEEKSYLVACYIKTNKETSIGKFGGKRVAILRCRDDILEPAIEECAKSAGADVVFSTTEYFV